MVPKDMVEWREILAVHPPDRGLALVLLDPPVWRQGGVAGLPHVADPADHVQVVLHDLDVLGRVDAGLDHVVQGGFATLLGNK